jgi:hypothetical protein
MQEQDLVLELLSSVCGGAETGCTVRNDATFPVSIIPTGAPKFQLLSGETGTMPNGEFSAIGILPGGTAGGLHGGVCQPGGAYSIVRDTNISWSNMPSIRQQ